MNAIVATRQNIDLSGLTPGFPDSENHVRSLLVQLDHYRRQSAWLVMVNKLQARLAGAADLSGMLEAFSVWLMPQIEHDLVVFRNTAKTRKHIACSHHGSVRRQIIQAAFRLLDEGLANVDDPCFRDGEYYGCCWRLDLANDSGQIMVMRRKQVIDPDGVTLLARTINILSEPLQRALEYENIFEQSRHDALTGLANRRVFDERIGCLMASADRYQRPLTIISMDLNRFKQLNDTQGHAEGDRALCRVAAALVATVRTTDLLIRMGGDEFILVLSDSGTQSVKKMAQRICQTVAALSFGENDSERLGISLGIAPWWPGLALEEWLQRADEALYRAKSTGRDWVYLDQSDQ